MRSFFSPHPVIVYRITGGCDEEPAAVVTAVTELCWGILEDGTHLRSRTATLEVLLSTPSSGDHLETLQDHLGGSPAPHHRAYRAKVAARGHPCATGSIRL